jgi:hypothetical protein
MTDGTLWVAALTGATAVLASWVTSRGNSRAARIQAEASALAQHHSRIRELRRAAYLDFIEQAHITGELYFRLGDVYAQLAHPDQQLARIQQLRSDLRDAFDPLMRSARVITLEGPTAVAGAAEAAVQAASEANTALHRIATNASDARERFDGAHEDFRLQLERFIDAARTAMTSTD